MSRSGVFYVLIPVIFSLLAGCGSDIPEVRLTIHEDSTHPCLGANHMKIKVNVRGKEIQYDEFGLFFKTAGTYGCSINQYIFSKLPLGKGVNVDFLLYDSSADPNSGLLSEAKSIDFNVSTSSPTRVIKIDLTRKPAIQEGTIIIPEPGNWEVSRVQMEVVILKFRVSLTANQLLVRSDNIATYDAVERKNPFPLIISNLPLGRISTEFNIQLDGLNRDAETKTTWGGTAWLGLGGGSTIAYVALQ